ncbi:MAG: hypothetical protein Q8M44_07280, partial [bacterium]|nr:hypothetical protein [bacterium]
CKLPTGVSASHITGAKSKVCVESTSNISKVASLEVGAVFITGAAFTTYVCVILDALLAASVAVYVTVYVHGVLKSTVQDCVTVNAQSILSFAVTVASVSGTHTVVKND